MKGAFIVEGIINEASLSGIQKKMLSQIKIFNENGLCSEGTNIDDVVILLDHGGIKWEPCYIYKVNFGVKSPILE